MFDPTQMTVLTRIADALERLAPPPAVASDLNAADGFVWNAERAGLDRLPRPGPPDHKNAKYFAFACGPTDQKNS